MRPNTLLFACSIAALSFTASCVDPDEDNLGEETSALSSIALHSLTSDTYDTKDLGGSFFRSCFLTSIAGDISTSFAPLEGPAGAGVVVVDGHWQLYVRPSSGSVTAKAACVNAFPSSTVTWSTGQANQVLTSTTSGKKCFLTEVTTSKNQTYLVGGLHTDSDVVRITSTGGNWVLGGSTAGLVTAKARCIDVTSSSVEMGVWAPAGQSLNTQTSILDADHSCFLTRMNGHFDSEGTGLLMFRALGPYSSAYYWSLEATNASGGGMRCVD